METHRRSIAKSVSWRLFALLITCVIACLITGSTTAGLVIGGFDCLVKIVTYYLHERLWLRVKWGVLLPAVSTEGDGAG